jgi:hypothetical protein
MKYPCIFKTDFHKEQINPRLSELGKVPFGDFTKSWRREHCARINPYGSEVCPYATEDCSISFLKVAEQAMRADNPGAYFRVAAMRTGIRRADLKPLARERYSRTDGQQEGAGGIRRGTSPGSPHVPGSALAAHPDRRVAGDGSMGVHRSRHRPQTLGSVLRGDDPGSRSRAYGRNEGQARDDHDEDRGDRVRETPPTERMGDKPPSGDPAIHQGGE